MNDWKDLNLNIMEGICRALANESFIIFSPITLDHAEGQSQSLNVRGKVLCICFFELPWWLSGKRIYLQCRSRVRSLGWEDPVERLLLSDKTIRRQDSWPPEETNSIQGQRRGWIAQSFCVIKFYESIKEIEKASDTGIRRGQK